MHGSGASRSTILASWAATAAALGLAVVTLSAAQATAVQVGLGLAIRGAAGNVREWVAQGTVTDFVDPGWWPAFNLADVSIAVGMAVAVAGLVR